jgi:hypothetical protein
MDHEEPTRDEVIEAFGDQIYRPADATARLVCQKGWGRSGDDISSITLHFLHGSETEPVIVEVSKERFRADPVTALQHLLFDISLGQPRFPIVIERGNQPVPIDGRTRMFTVYTTGAAAVGVATVEDVEVMVRCSRSRFASLALVPITPADLNHAFSRRR